jgi:Tfp pilus assembly protein PilX
MRPNNNESGFALISVILGIVVASLIVLVAVSAVNGDLRVGSRDIQRKQAYEAAQAGLADYMFHLNTDTNYWAKCTAVPTPNAVNLNGSTTKRRAVPGNTGATYSIELIPATGKAACDPANPVSSMIESGGQSTGTFRIRSTGYSGSETQKIVASFKRASFLDYVYFTQLETSDPVTYGDAATIAGANQQCTKTVAQGRYNAAIPNSGGKYCDVISFIDGEQINGPMHTNDAFVICGQPYFGRNVSDAIEVSSPPQGWFTSCNSSDTPIFRGTYVTRAPVLTPPPTNSSLTQLPGVLAYIGQTKIVLNSTGTMNITNNGITTNNVPIPTSGVVYIKNGICSSGYNPFTVTYPTTSTCGNAIVSGTYTGQLTIAAENDVIIDGSITKSGTNALLGLIANNFVRIKHPICASTDLGCTGGTKSQETAKGSCNSGVNGTGSLSNLQIDAAILAIAHSFIVDHYDCGSSLGTLTVNGAISQKFRGAVGTFGGGGGTGYTKNYNYDDRLRYISPPHFLDPVESAWHMQRQTLDP